MQQPQYYLGEHRYQWDISLSKMLSLDATDVNTAWDVGLTLYPEKSCQGKAGYKTMCCITIVATSRAWADNDQC